MEDNKDKESVIINGVLYVKKPDTTSAPIAQTPANPSPYHEPQEKSSPIWLYVVGLVLLSFVVPGLGFFAIIGLLIFTKTGAKEAEKRDIETYGKVSAKTQAFKLLGRILLTFVLLFIAFIAIVFVAFSTGSLKIG